MFEVFSQTCLTFGLLCAFVAFLANRKERRDIDHSAAMRRVQFPAGSRMIYQEDGKPLCWEDDQV
jgi:hypothetical protein